MNDLESKIIHQLKAILSGETGLIEEAHKHSVNVERVEEQIRILLDQKKIFGSDDIMDIVMAGYVIGRRDQALATFAHLVGKEKLQELYNKICIELGIVARRLN